jgi:hypothetical protein
MRALAFAVGFLVASAAWAEDFRGYAGAALGASSEPATCQEDLTRRCEGNALGLRFFGGYAVSRAFAVEAGVAGDGGEAVLDLSAVGSVPLAERAALYGRIGVFGGGKQSDFTFGIGLRVDLAEQTAVQLEAQHYNADVLWLGLLFRF